MCDNCNSLLPNKIKFELWRPLQDDFLVVLDDAIKYLEQAGKNLDSITTTPELD